MGRKRAGSVLKESAKKRCQSESKTETTSDQAQSAEANLWDADHKGGQEIICESDRYHDLLISNSSTLLKHLKLTDSLWTLLLQRDVIDERIKAKIQVKKTEKAQVLSLVNHLIDLKVYKLHGFIWALVNSHQHQIAKLLGFDVCNYIDNDIFMKYSNFRCPACSEFYTKAYIMTGCGHYICAPCVKGAQFICKNDGREDITCPVPDCNEITEADTSKGSIGLDEDIPFRDLCQVLVKEMTGTDCCDCNVSVSVSPVKHHCNDCDKVLCAECTNKHKEDKVSHNVVHQHLTDQCCLHGKSTKAFCDLCDVYYCDQDAEVFCGHEKLDTEAAKEWTEDIAGKLKKHIAKLNDNVSSIIKNRNILSQYEAGVKEYIKAEEQKVKQIADAWAKENLQQYSNIQKQVETRLKQFRQWQKVASELSTYVKIKPWLIDVDKIIAISLKENIKIITSDDMDLPMQLSLNCPIPTMMTPLPLIMRPPNEGMTISHTFKNISKLTTRQSPPILSKNHLWSIDVKRVYYDEFLSFSINVKSKPRTSESQYLRIPSRVECRMLNWNTDQEPLIKRRGFRNSMGTHGFSRFISWNELMDPENGYVKENSIRLEAHILPEEPEEEEDD